MSESLMNKQAFKKQTYYQRNRKKCLQYQKEYYEKNKAEILKYNKRNKNKKAYNKKYYEANKKRLLKYQKIYRNKLKRLYYEWNEQRRAKEELARFTPEERRQYDLWEIEWNKKFKETQKHTVY